MKYILLLVLIFGNLFVYSQTLFTYGKYGVDKNEFVKAFEKSPVNTKNKQKALEDYLQLFINYKLKVQAAYDEQLNEQNNIAIENKNYRNQIADAVINEEADIKGLTKEAFERTQKDILAAQVFVSFGKDSANAYKQIQQAYHQLQLGISFNAVSQVFSSDEDVKNSNSIIGYITAFTLPYDIENIIYQLKPGSFSAIYKGKYGYHIFKNINERSAIGKRRVAQILFAYPPNATETDKKKTKQLADSVYKKIISGTLFEELAIQFNASKSNNNGLLPDIGIGEYNKDFEDKVFGLEHLGEVTPPFETAYGYHILKLISIIPVEKKMNDALAASLKQKIETSDRMNVAKKQLLRKWLVTTECKEADFNETELWQYTQASVNEQKFNSSTINDSTILFSFPKKKITVTDWLNALRGKLIEKNTADYYANLFNDFLFSSVSNYYKDHLEEYSKQMREQLKEFTDANLLFAVMDKHVWSKANDDSILLKDFYQTHINQYQWQQGFSAIVINSKTKETALEIIKNLQKNIKYWRNIISNYGSSAFADSGRFEDNQSPVRQKIEKRIGFISTPEKNTTDNNYVSLMVTQIHDSKEQKTFAEAKNAVINDYQQQLEEKWIVELKKKYPVIINQAVWKTVK